MVLYSTQLLSKQGPLRIIWVAAHLERQLKRAQVNSTSITDSIAALQGGEVPLALRLSGQLLLGLVRIHRRKIEYLLQDCDGIHERIAAAGTAAAAAPHGQHHESQQEQQEQGRESAQPRATRQRGQAAATAAAAAAAPGARESQPPRAVASALEGLEGVEVDFEDAFPFGVASEEFGLLHGASQRSAGAELPWLHSGGSQSQPLAAGSLASGGLGWLAATDEPEVFEDLEADADGFAAFDLTELEVLALRAGSTAATATATADAGAGASQRAAPAERGSGAAGDAPPGCGAGDVAASSEHECGAEQQAPADSGAVGRRHSSACDSTDEGVSRPPAELGLLLDSSQEQELQLQEQEQQELPGLAEVATPELQPPQAAADAANGRRSLRKRPLEQGPEQPQQHGGPAPSGSSQEAAGEQHQQPEAGSAGAPVPFEEQAVLQPARTKRRRRGLLAELCGGLAPPVVDDDTAHNRVPTELPGSEIRALLADRSPLLTDRCAGLAAGTLAAAAAEMPGGAHARRGAHAAAPEGPRTVHLRQLVQLLPLASPGEAGMLPGPGGPAPYGCQAELFNRAAAAALQQQALFASDGARCLPAAALQLLAGSGLAAAALAAAAAAGGLGPGPAAQAGAAGSKAEAALEDEAGEPHAGSSGALPRSGGLLAGLAATSPCLSCAAPGLAISPLLGAALVRALSSRLAGGATDREGPAAAGAGKRAAAGSKPKAGTAGKAATRQAQRQQEEQQQVRREPAQQEQAALLQPLQPLQLDFEAAAGVDEPQKEQQLPEQQEQEQEQEEEQLPEPDNTQLLGSMPASSEEEEEAEHESDEEEELAAGGEQLGSPAGAAPAGSAKADASAGFTRVTRRVLVQLKQLALDPSAAAAAAAEAAAPAAPERKRGRQADTAEPQAVLGNAGSPPLLRFSALLHAASARRSTRAAAAAGGGGPSRRDASRTFYECLVLQNRGYLALSQASSYGELSIAPRDKLLQ